MKKDIELKEFIKNYKWEQGSRRVTTLHRFFDFSESGEIASKEMFGAGMTQEIFVVKNGDIVRFQVSSDWDSFVDGLIEFFNKSASVKWASEHMFADSDLFINWLKNNCQKTHLAKLTNEELAEIIKKRHSRHQNLLAWQWFGFVGKYPIDKILKNRLTKYSITEDELKSILVHKRPISIIEEELAAKKIAIDVQESKLNDIELKNELMRHLEKFGHIVVYDETNDLMDFDFIKNRINEHVKNRELGSEIAKTEAQFKKNKQDFDDLILKHKFSGDELDFIVFADKFAHFMEIRNEYRAFAAIYSRDLFKTIAERLNLKLQELLCFTDYEIEDALIGKCELSVLEAKNRFELSTVITNGQRYLISIGNDAKEVEEFITKKYDVTEIKGNPTNKGVASGKVKIVIDLEDVKKVERGDILVSPMTKPVFLLAMKKAAAIVTDEGGMLCHAAVISRELNIPCIVGTKIATQVLKDEDVVEVDANRGVIKILK